MPMALPRSLGSNTEVTMARPNAICMATVMPWTALKMMSIQMFQDNPHSRDAPAKQVRPVRKMRL